MATSSQSVPGIHTPPALRPDWGTRILATFAGRLLLPSLSDLFFVALLLWLFVAGADGWKQLLVDGDCGWHIRTGDYILDHHAVPHVDLFSFSKAGEPWYAWEWLSDVLFAGLFRWAGLKAVTLAAAAVITAYATIVLRRIFAQGANLFVALVVALLTVGAASIHFLARPHIFTLLFLAISLWMIEDDRKRPGRRIWLLVPLTILWTNMHGGFLALILVLGCLTLGTAIESALQWTRAAAFEWRGSARYAILTASCAASSLINPYGVQLHIHIFEYLSSDWIRNVVFEFQSPSFRNENVIQFEVLMFLGLLTAAVCLGRKRVVEALWIVVFAHLALGSVRHVPIFVTVAAPTIAAELTILWQKWTARMGRKSVAAILEKMGRDLSPGFQRGTVWPCLLVVLLACLGDGMNWPKDLPDLTFPTRMAAAHSELLLNHRIFSSDQWGDYLIFRNYPHQKVFVDGRSDFYGPKLGDQYMHAMQASWEWRQVLDQYAIDVVLAPVSWSLASVLKLDARWTLVADDGQAILFSRKLPVSTSGLAVPRD